MPTSNIQTKRRGRRQRVQPSVFGWKSIPRRRRPQLEALESKLLLTTVTWTGNVDTQWDNAGNWDTAQVPVDNDDVIIPASASGAEVFFDSNDDVTLDSLDADKPFRISGGTLTLNTGGVFTFDDGLTLEGGGTIDGPADFSINTAPFTWNSGIVGGSGTVTVNGGMTVSSSNVTLDGRNMDLASDATYSTNQPWLLDNGAVLTVESGNTLNFTGTGVIDDFGSENDVMLIIEGTVRRYTSTSTATIDVITENNSSETVRVETGLLQFTRATTSSGTWDALTNAELRFSTDVHQFNTGSTIMGDGLVRIASSATFRANNDLVIDAALEFDSGTMDGNGNFTTNQNFQWDGGTVLGSGTELFTVNGGLTVNGSVVTLDGRDMDLASETTFSTSQPWRLDNGAVLTVQSGNTLNLTSTGTIDDFGGNGDVMLVIEGTVRRHASTSTVVIDVITENNSNETVRVETGTLHFTRATTSSGTWDVLTDAELRFSTGVHQFNTGSTIIGNGLVHIASGTFRANDALVIDPVLEFDSGTMDGNGNFTTTKNFQWDGGTVLGSGIELFTVNGGLTVPASVITLDGRDMNLASNTTFSTSQPWRLDNGAILTIESGNTLNITGTGTIDDFGSNDDVMLVIEGTVRRHASASTATIDVITENNSNETVSVETGTLNFTRATTSSGAWEVLAGAEIGFSNTLHQFNMGTTIVGDGLVRIASGTFRANAALVIDAELEFDGGIMDGNANFTTSKNFKWDFGTVLGSGTELFTVNGGLTVSSSTVTLDGRDMNLASDTTFSTTQPWSLDNTAVLTIESGNTLNITSSGTIDDNGSNDDVMLIIEGTVRRHASTSTANIDVISENNSTETVRVETGVLNFTRATTNVGAWDIFPGAEVGFSNGTHQFNTGTTFTGSGNVRFGSGTSQLNEIIAFGPSVEVDAGTVEGSNNVTINGNLQLDGGSITTSGDWIVNGPFDWNGGTFGGTGTATINGDTTVSSSTVTLDGRDMNLASDAMYSTSQPWRLDNGAVLTIESGNTLEITGTGTIDDNGSNDDVMLVIEGTVRRHASAFTATIDVITENNSSETVRVETGLLHFTRASTSGGTWEVLAGAELSFSTGVHQFNTGSTITGDGLVRIASGTFRANAALVIDTALEFDSGTMDGTGDFTTNKNFKWDSGTVSGSGTELFTVNGGLTVPSSVVTLDGRNMNLASDATYSTTQPWRLDNGAVLTIESGNTLNITSTGTIDDNGSNDDVMLVIEGTVRRHGSTATANIDVISENNSTETVRVETGVLHFTRATTNDGAWDIFPGAEVGFSIGTHQFNTGTTFTGSGNVRFFGSGTFQLNEVIPFGPSVEIDAGTVEGSNDITTNGSLQFDGGSITTSGDWTVNGPFDWNGGTFGGTGTTTVNDGLTVSSGLVTLDGRNIDLASDATYSTSQPWRLDNGAVLTIESGNTLNITSTGTIDDFGSNDDVMLIIEGTVRRHASASTANIDVITENNSTETVRVETGLLHFTRSSDSSGTWDVFTDAELRFSTGVHQFNMGTIITGDGLVRIASSATFRANDDLVIDAELEFDSGTMEGAGNFTTSKHLKWDGGTVLGSGTELFTVDGGLTVSSSVVTLDGRNMNLASNATYSTSQPWRLDNLAVLTVESANTLDITSTGTIDDFGSNNDVMLIIEGTVRRQASTSTATVDVITENNSNETVRVETGLLNFTRASISSGEWEVLAGAELRFSTGVHEFNMGTTIMGDGLVRIESGTFRANDDLVIDAALEFDSGTMDGNGDFTTSRNFQWDFGTILGSGTELFTVNGGLTVASSTATLDGRNMNLASDSTYSTSQFWRLDNGAVLTIESGNTLNITGNGTIDDFGSNDDVSFVNQGTVLRDTATGTATIDVIFTVNSTVEVRAGTLNITRQFTNFVTDTLSDGEYRVIDDGSGSEERLGWINADLLVNDATVLLDGPNTLITNSSFVDALGDFGTNTASGDFTIQNGRNQTVSGGFDNAGNMTIGDSSTFAIAGGQTYQQTSGNTTLDSGNLTADTVDLQGGNLQGNGSVNGNIQNSGGNVSPGLSPGSITTGDYTQGPGGTFSVEIVSAGDTGGVDHDELDAQGDVSLDGTLAITTDAGHAPTVGESHTVIPGAASLTGQFSTVTGSDLGDVGFWVPAYSATQLLVVLDRLETGGDQTADEGDVVSLNATFTDPGSHDDHSATVDWGDGTGAQAIVVDELANEVNDNHVYADNNTYTVTVTLSRPDGTGTTQTFEVTVNNADPTVEAGSNQTVDEGTTVALDPATFNDPGTADTHTATIDWDDGPIQPGVVTETPTGPPGNAAGADGTVDGSHFYADPGVFTVTVEVTDDDGGVGSDTLTVTVNDVLPSIAVAKTANPTSVDEPGGTVDFTVEITNTSVASTDPVTINSLMDSVHGDLNGQGTCVGAVGTIISPGDTFSCTFTAAVNGNVGEDETNTVTVMAADDEANPLTETASALVTINDVLPSITVTKTANPTSVDEPGGTVDFTVEITNTSVATDPVTINSLMDDVHGNLNGQGTCVGAVGTTINPGDTLSCSFTAAVNGNVGEDETNTVTVMAADDEANPLTETASALVTINDVLPSITVTKTANPTSVDEPGGSVDFTVEITNTSVATDPVTINSLMDDVHGDLNGQGTCVGAVGTTINPGDTFSCTFTAAVNGNVGEDETNTVTVMVADDEANPFTETASALVTINDVLPSITVTKTANPQSVDEPGGLVTFTIEITNDSGAEDLMLDSLVDDQFGDLDGQGSCSVPQTLSASGVPYSCSFDGNVTGTPGTHVNTVTAEVSDDDGNTIMPTASETVTINAVADLSITKTDSPDPVQAGNNLTYTITVSNAGPSDAQNVQVVDMLPPGTTFVSQTDNCVEAPVGTLTCSLGTASAGADTSFEITVTVDPGVSNETVLTNSAAVSSTTTDPNTGNNTTTEDTTANKSTVVGRHIFYNNSAFDGNDAAANVGDDGAIAPDKSALLPGQTAAFTNYTSYSRGINGIMIDIQGLANPSAITLNDFEFRVGNDNTPGNWAIAPVPLGISLRAGAGIGGSNRFTITWADNVIEKRWLQVIVQSTANTGLQTSDVHYWGNAVGDSGNSTTNTQVNATDELNARFNQHNFLDPAPLHDFVDYNRDARVNATDELIARFNQTNFLTDLNLISVPAPPTAPSQAFVALANATDVGAGTAELDWRIASLTNADFDAMQDAAFAEEAWDEWWNE